MMLSNWLFYIGVPLILGIWAQARVSGAFRRYSQVRASSGLTGAQAAREIMDAAQIHDVNIVQINGMLGDHYDPTQKRLCLSTETYNSPSIAAVGIAAHETGHAIQHARAYAPLQWRMTIVPVTQFASQLLPFVIIGGFWYGGGYYHDHPRYIGPAVHPAFGPSATPHISRPSPRLAVTKPGTSNRPAAGWAWSARKTAPKASANTPTGTFT